MEKHRDKLTKRYYDVEAVGSYGGIQSLAKKTKVQPEVVKSWLETQDVYTLHKPVRHKFPRRKVIVLGPNQQWQADLIDMSRLKSHNHGFTFVLTCIDVFSKKAWAIPIKNKTGASLVSAFESIPDVLPKSLQTDKGTEFTNNKFQKWLKKNDVHFFTSENDDIKASVVERFNRTLKSKLWRYFSRHNTLDYASILETMVDVYNHTPHRSIRMAPLDVNEKNKVEIWFRLYADPIPYKDTKLKVGDTVRISKTRRVFKKGYLAQWSEEIFKINRRKSTQPPTFILEDYAGEILKGTFYPQELQKISKKDDVYQIEKVLKREKHRLFVKWKGYPNKFNSWVSTKDLV